MGCLQEIGRIFYQDTVFSVGSTIDGGGVFELVQRILLLRRSRRTSKYDYEGLVLHY